MTRAGRLVDSAGDRLQLGPQLGKGGEGVVYELANSKGEAVKVFHKHLPKTKAAKIRHLATLAGDKGLASLVALPRDLVHDDTGLPIGLILPLVSKHNDIHHLYSPKSRRQSFPTTDWRFLAHTCVNLSKAFAAVHAQGLVIGDVNHGSVLVSQQATVRLIDADSFQVRTGNDTLRCTVGIPMFTPPELHGSNFASTDRSSNHDAFGLAVLIFHLLMMGRHPYVGVHADKPTMSLEDAIRSDRYAFSARGGRPVSPPASAPPIEVLPSSVRDLFESAFGPGHRRPAATRWMTELQRLERNLRSCASVRAHAYSSHLSVCPWCAYERKTNVVLFGTVSQASSAPVIDVGWVWALLDAAPPLPDVSGQIRSAARTRTPIKDGGSSAGGNLLLIGGFAGLVALTATPALGIGIWVLTLLVFFAISGDGQGQVLRDEVRTARVSLETAIQAFDQARTTTNYARHAATLKDLRNELQMLPQEQRRRHLALEANQQSAQKKAFLESRLIMDADINGIGPSRTAVLASYGVDSAADIDRAAIMRIPGFGPSLAGNLMDWRRSVESRFRFNPKKPIDPQLRRKIDEAIADERARLSSEVQRIGGRLKADQRRAIDTLRPLLQNVEAAHRRLLSANRALADSSR